MTVTTRQPAVRQRPGGHVHLGRVRLQSARGRGPAGHGQQHGHGRAGVPPGAGEPPGLLGGQPPGHHQEQPAGPAGDLVQPAGQVAAPGLLDHRQRVEQRVLERCPGRTPGPWSVTSCPSSPARARYTPMDAAALTANSNEEPAPGPLCARRPGVQQQYRAVAPVLFLAPHHQLTVPRGGPPVHPAQLVAVPVGAAG